MLRKQEGDPSALMRLYPNFNPDAIPDDKVNPILPYLHEAIFNEHFHAVRGLVQCGASLLQVTKLCRVTVLNMACRHSSEAVIAYLLQTNDGRTTVNWADTFGITPLHMSIGNAGQVRMLLKHGASASMEHKNWMRRTPVQKARNRGHMATVKVLEAAEIALKVHNNLGEWRPWISDQFSSGYRSGIYEVLLLAKAKVNYKK